MTQNIRMILTPFLTISYVFGLRITNLPIINSKLWFNLLYVLLIWLIYYFLSTCSLIYSAHVFHPIEYHICYWLEIFINLITITFGMYYDKKFQSCLKKLDIVDNTLLQLRTVTDYDKLNKKSLWLVLGWFIITISLNSVTTLFIKVERDYDILTAMLLVFTQNYFFHINIIGDLTTATILGYIGLKFDQINKHLRYMMTNNDHKMKQVWKNLIHSHQCRFSKTMYNKHMIWIIVHLHLELRKIFCEIDSIFGKQMTFKMACYFGWIAIDLREILYAILIKNYVKSRMISITLHLIWLCHNVFKFILINYMCEKVSTKTNATTDLLNKFSYLTCDIEIREIISQFLLRQVYAPLRFCGIGLYQFGFKFLHRFVMSIATVLVIIIQAHANK